MHYLRVIIIFICLSITTAIAHTTTAIKNTKEIVFKSITTLNGSLNKKTAELYANIIDKYSHKYGVDPLLVVAIAKQEGNFILNKKNYQEVYDEKGKIRRVITDYCMMQINKSNLVSMKLNPKKLLTDPDYCIKTGVKILASLKSYSRYEKNWWSRYNSVSIKNRNIYKKNVLHFYRKISFELV